MVFGCGLRSARESSGVVDRRHVPSIIRLVRIGRSYLECWMEAGIHNIP
jgi:hypothetical protein